MSKAKNTTTADKTSKTVKVGPFRVFPHKQKGVATGKFHVDIPAIVSSSGKRHRPLFDNRETAKAFANRLFGELQHASHLQQKPAKPGRRPLFSVVAQKWENTLRTSNVVAEEIRKNSADTEIYRLNALKKHLGSLRVDRIDDQSVTDFKAGRLQAGVSKRTVNAELALLRRVLKNEGVEPPKKTKAYKLPQVAHVVPTARESRQIIEQLKGHRKVLVRLCAEAGLRPDEAYHATAAWFSRDQHGRPQLRVQAHQGWIPKTDYSPRVIPISEDLYAAALALDDGASYWLFPSRKDHTKPVTNIRKSLQAAARDAKIKRHGRAVYFPLKMFRKAFGTTLATNRVARATIQDLVGHRRGSPVTEEFYIFPEDDAVRDAVTCTWLGEQA